MRVSLAMIVRNEERYLSLILPIIRPSFEEFVALDACSTDRTKEVLKEFNCRVFDRPWNNNFSEARNEALRHVTGDWVMMLDGDEAMFPEDLERLRSRMDAATAICLTRIEFVLDHRHVDRTVYPDWQCRVFKAGIGYHFKGVVHEMLFAEGEAAPVLSNGRASYVEDCPIYHYGQCKPRENVWLKHHNYGLVTKGLPPLERVPEGFHVPPREGLSPFDGPHPLRNAPH